VNLLTLPFILAQATESATDLTPGGTQEMPQINPALLIIPILFGLVFGLALGALMFWKVFTKAGQPGWASIVPIYNAYILCKIAGKPGWWVVLLMIPLVGFIFAALLCIALAEAFGQGAGFGIGLLLLSIIFFPILGFGSARYQGAAGNAPPLPGAAY
jgi:hypothetical protein